MSVREQLFLRTDLPPVAIARTIADLVGGTADDRGSHAYVTVDTSRLFDGTAVDAPVIHVRTDDVLVAASIPGRGVHRPPAGTTVYDWDEDRWNGFVVLPDGPR